VVLGKKSSKIIARGGLKKAVFRQVSLRSSSGPRRVWERKSDLDSRPPGWRWKRWSESKRGNPRTEGFKPETGKSTARQKEEVICFWCREEGHHEADCTNPPFCFRCKESGHLSAKCPKSQGTSLNMYGFGFPGQGFYSLKLPGGAKQQKKPENVGLIRVRSGEDSVIRIENELKHLIDSKWQWGVKLVADREYVAVFPNKQILDTFSRSNGFEMALHKIFVTVTPTNINLAASSMYKRGGFRCMTFLMKQKDWKRDCYS
jgi:hypothetical protein